MHNPDSAARTTLSPQMKALATAMSRNPGKSALELLELVGSAVVPTRDIHKRLLDLCERGAAHKKKNEEQLYVYFITQQGLDMLNRPAEKDEDAEQSSTPDVSPAGVVNSIFSLGQATGHFNNKASTEEVKEAGRKGARAKARRIGTDATLSGLGKTTHEGLGWVAPPTNEPATEINEELRVALWSDGSLDIVDGVNVVMLDPEKAKQFFAYTDLVRHVGRFEA